MHLYEQKTGSRHRGLLLTVLVFAAMLAAFAAFLSGTRGRQNAASAEQLETALRQASVTCYAIEGRYPESLAYLMEHYGVSIAYDQFVVQYEVFAENIMPVIRVLEIGGAS